MTPRILIVDDEDSMRFFLTEALKKRGYTVEEAVSAEDAIDKCSEQPFDLIITDGRLPGIDGVDAIPKIREVDPDAAIIVMTAYGSQEMHSQAFERGAYDFFTKPFKMEEMSIVVRRALERQGLQSEVKTLREQLNTQYDFENIIGTSHAMQNVFRLIKRVVQTDVTALICGETGTGKELIAQAIHYHSKRKDKPFIKLNCVAIPENLLESELFGHEKGSFTGAVSEKAGKFEMANGGTIFLDEIGDMTLATQSKILRVLQEREFERVGGTRTINVDVRVIAATNKDLTTAVEDNKFREDLYYRLNVFSISTPPLRERKEDIPLLLEHFLHLCSDRLGKQLDGFDNEAMDLLTRYDWPGNVRELENYVQRAVVMCDSAVIGPQCLPQHVQSLDASPSFTVPERTNDLDDTLADVETQIIVDTLHKTAGLQSKAAKMLGISERSLWHRVKKLKIDIARIKATV